MCMGVAGYTSSVHVFCSVFFNVREMKSDSRYIFCAIFWSIATISSVLSECDLTNAEKFDQQCVSLDVSYPSNVYFKQEFNIEINSGSTKFHNISLFNSSTDFCGSNTFYLGLQCSFTQTNNVKSVATVNCNANNTLLDVGPVALIIGVTDSVTCSILLPVIWGQSELFCALYIYIYIYIYIYNLFLHYNCTSVHLYMLMQTNI